MELLSLSDIDWISFIVVDPIQFNSTHYIISFFLLLSPPHLLLRRLLPYYFSIVSTLFSVW